MSVRVTVLMAAYNAQKYLRASLDSIFCQEFQDFEFVVVDDASCDSTAEILARVSDSRLRVVSNQENLGLGASLNRGLELAQGEYIVRHDADDESLPQRLSRQVSYLDAHPEVGVLGANMQMIAADGQPLDVYRVPESQPKIAWHVAFGHAFGHPSVAMRHDVLQAVGGYAGSSQGRAAQDQELWSRLALVVGMANLPEVLVRYRVHEGMTSTSSSGHQWHNDLVARQAFVQQVLGRPVPEDVLRWVRPLDREGYETEAPLREISDCAGVVLEVTRELDRRFEGAGSKGSLNSLAGEKLYGLAAQAARHGSRTLAVSLLLRAVRLCPTLLSPHVFGRILRRAFSSAQRHAS